MADSAAAPKPSSSVKLVLLGEAAVGKVSQVLGDASDTCQPGLNAMAPAFCAMRPCYL